MFHQFETPSLNVTMPTSAETDMHPGLPSINRITSTLTTIRDLTDALMRSLNSAEVPRKVSHKAVLTRILPENLQDQIDQIFVHLSSSFLLGKEAHNIQLASSFLRDPNVSLHTALKSFRSLIDKALQDSLIFTTTSAPSEVA